jgi:hypothetical protein
MTYGFPQQPNFPLMILAYAIISKGSRILGVSYNVAYGMSQTPQPIDYGLLELKHFPCGDILGGHIQNSRFSRSHGSIYIIEFDKPHSS